MLLADASQDPTALGAWMQILFYVGGFAFAAVHVWKALKPNPANHEVYAKHEALMRLEAKVAEEDQRLHDRISTQREEMQRQFSAQREAGEARADRIVDEVKSLGADMRADIKGLHTRVTTVVTTVARIEGQISKEP
jgi:nucleotide-binding universal stress UspA family protein